METIQLNNGYNLHLEYDENPLHPRKDNENLGTLVCWHNRYKLSDTETNLSPTQYLCSLWEEHATDKEVREIIAHYLKTSKIPLSQAKYELGNVNDYRDLICEYEILHPDKDFPDAVIGHTVYMYEHSGITVKSTPYQCSWDSGKVGLHYITKEKLKSEGLADRTNEEILEILDADIKTYARYLEGQVYSIEILNAKGESVYECSGFYGYTETIEVAKEIIKDLCGADD